MARAMHASGKRTRCAVKTGKSRMTSRTPWRVKLEKPQCSKVVPMPARMAKRLGPGTLAIPTPLDVDKEIRRVPAGELITVRQIRERLAMRYGATTSCPLCVGIFLRIAAETAEEDLRSGRDFEDITPYWRVVTDDGCLNPKFPGGVASQSRRLMQEGHLLVPGKGSKPPRIKDFSPELAAVAIAMLAGK